MRSFGKRKNFDTQRSRWVYEGSENKIAKAVDTIHTRSRNQHVVADLMPPCPLSPISQFFTVSQARAQGIYAGRYLLPCLNPTPKPQSQFFPRRVGVRLTMAYGDDEKPLDCTVDSNLSTATGKKAIGIQGEVLHNFPAEHCPRARTSLNDENTYV